MSKPTLEQIAAYEHFPTRLSTAIDGLSEEQLHFIPAIGEWSIHEVLIHLADSETVGYWRLRKTLAEPRSPLAVYDQEIWANKLSYRIQDRELALHLFAALRASTAALLRLLPDEAWERLGVHEEQGEVSVFDLFMLYLDHGKIHLEQITQLKRSFREKQL